MPVSTGASRAPVPTMERAPQPLDRAVGLRDHRAVEKGKAPEPLPQNKDAQVQQRVEQARQKAEKLEDFKKTHEDPKETIGQVPERTTSLSDTEVRQLNRVDPALAQEARQFDTYSSIVDEAKHTGRSEADVCKSRQPPVTPDQFTALRTDVLTRMSRMEYVREAIPGFEDMSTDEQLVAVDAFAASHEGVRTAYIGRMREIVKQAINLPENPAEASQQAASSRRAELGAERQVTRDRLRARLGEKGKGLADDQIDAMFAGGRTVDEIEMDMVDAVLKQNGIEPSHYHARQEQQANQQRMKALESEFRQAHQSGELANSTFNLDLYLQGNSGDARVAEYQTLVQRNGAIEGMKINLTPQNEQTIHEVEEAVYGRINYAKGGVRVGGIREDLQRLHDNHAQTQQVERTAKAPLTGEAQRAQDGMTMEQERLRQEMVVALEDSVREAFNNDYQDFVDTNNRKMEADALDAAEKGDVRLHDGIIAIQKNQDRHGVGLDPATGETVVNRPDIGSDVRRIAQDGDEGVRRIMLRDLSEGEHPVISLYETDDRGVVIRYDAQGKPTTDGSGEPKAKYYVDGQGMPCKSDAEGAKPATWETIRYDQLAQDDRALLDQIQTQEGGRVAQKVMADYLFALKPPIKGLHIVSSENPRADLKLTSGQEAALTRYFGEEGVREAFSDSREYKKINDVLREKGINPDKGGIGVLLMILIMLGGGFARKKED